MPITAASLVLPLDPECLGRLRTFLAVESRVTVGPERNGRLAIVIETETTRDGQELLAAIAGLDGVGAVLPVFHNFEDEAVSEQGQE